MGGGRIVEAGAVRANTRTKQRFFFLSVIIAAVVGLFIALLVLIPVAIKTSIGYGTSDQGQGTCIGQGVRPVKPIEPHVEHVKRQTEHVISQIEQGQEIARSASSSGSVHVRPEKKSGGPGNHRRLRKRSVSMPVIDSPISDVRVEAGVEQRAAPSPSLHKPDAHSGEKSRPDEIKVVDREIIVKRLNSGRSDLCKLLSLNSIGDGYYEFIIESDSGIVRRFQINVLPDTKYIGGMGVLSNNNSNCSGEACDFSKYVAITPKRCCITVSEAMKKWSGRVYVQICVSFQKVQVRRTMIQVSQIPVFLLTILSP